MFGVGFAGAAKPATGHLLHVGVRVLVDDDVDRGRELDVAADVVAVRVRVDDRVTGFGVSSLILSRIGWPQPGFFVSTTVTPLAVHEHGGVAAAALPQDEEVVLELLDLDDPRRSARPRRLLDAATVIDSAPTAISTPSTIALVSCHPSRKEDAFDEPERSRRR